jgi:hypothetical protein
MIRVTIVGLKPNQAQAVQRQFGGAVRFHFLPADRSDTRLPSGTDWAIVTRFAGHRWSWAALDQLPRQRVSYCAGGVLSVIQNVAHALQHLEPSSRVA